MKKIVIAPDSFKGTLSAVEVCQAVKSAAGRIFPEAQILCLPLADGGEGTVACFAALPGSAVREENVTGPLGEKLAARYAVLQDGTAVVETASAAGLPLVRGREDPMVTTTYGLGELILSAAKSGANRILVGLGGSCTTDGGAGAAAAAGVRFLDHKGNMFVPAGGNLNEVVTIDLSGVDPAVKRAEIVLLCDVTSPLYGKTGAAYVFAPQKGASPDEVVLLDQNLRHIGAMYDKILPGASSFPGAGAAGGLGAGMSALLGARIVPGIDAVLTASGADEAFAGADLIVTGEGKVDSQSLTGKVISGVAQRAKDVPVIVMAGVVDCDPDSLKKSGILAAFGVHPKPVPLEVAAKNALKDLETAAESAFYKIRERI